MSETKFYAFVYSRNGFPRINENNLILTSPIDKRYNCIAWAAEENYRWWWPDPMGIGHWPPQAPRAETREAFIIAYGTLGYVECDNADYEDGFEKIMVYFKDGKPTHAARLIERELWTSKLGENHDISHKIDLLNGPLYGQPELFMKRPKKT